MDDDTVGDVVLLLCMLYCFGLLWLVVITEEYWR